MNTLRIVIISAVCAFSSTRSLVSQVAYQAANAPTSIVPRWEGLLSLDIAEASVGLTFVKESGCGAECDGAGIGLAIFLSAAARKGQASLFSQVEFVPGWKAGGRLTYAFDRSDGASNVFVFATSFSTTQRRTVEINADSMRATLDELNQHDLEFLFGYNHVFSPGATLGLGFIRRKEVSTPGLSDPLEVCVPGTQPGSSIVFPLCSDRYVGPLGDRWVTQIRSDVIIPVLALGDARLKPVLAVITAASVDILAQGDAVNLGIGPAIIPSSYSGHVIASLLLELYDAFDANGVAPKFGDRFVVRLGIGVPLDVFLGN